MVYITICEWWFAVDHS